jgi:eukaryotic translation initiation factor 2C
MIKFAVSRPGDRKESIRKGLDLLKWDTDPFLSNYGLKIDRNMLKTEARVLNPPTVLFGKKVTVAPGFSGRWDLRGKQFLLPNHAPLKSWGVCIIKGPRPYVLDPSMSYACLTG